MELRIDRPYFWYHDGKRISKFISIESPVKSLKSSMTRPSVLSRHAGKDAVRWCKQAVYPNISIQHLLISSCALSVRRNGYGRLLRISNAQSPVTAYCQRRIHNLTYLMPGALHLAPEQRRSTLGCCSKNMSHPIAHPEFSPAVGDGGEEAYKCSWRRSHPSVFINPQRFPT